MASGVAATYMLCQYFANSFQHATSAFGEVGVYFLFSLSFTIIRPIMRSIGYLSDKNKIGGPSIEVLMEMSISFFFYTFYRNLFISVRSFGLFFVIKAVHVVFEVCNYTICFSKWYRKFVESAYERYHESTLQYQIISCISGCRNVETLEQAQCFRSGMRFYLFRSSVVTFILFFTFLRYGYNSSFYCAYNEISEDHYLILMSMTGLSIVIELIVFWYTDILCFSTYGHGILRVWQEFLSGKVGLVHRSVIVYMIWLMAHVTADIYLYRIDTSSIGGPDCPDIEYD